MAEGGEQRIAPAMMVGMGPILMVIVLVIAIPVSVMMSGAIAAGLLGFAVKDEVDRNHADSELLKTNY